MKGSNLISAIIASVAILSIGLSFALSISSDSDLQTLVRRNPSNGVGPFPEGPNCGDSIPADALLPNMQTVVPKHLSIQNDHQTEFLRFSNGITNTGEGKWQMIPIFPDDEELTQAAAQQFLDSDGQILCQKEVSETVFHPAHNHWHMADIAKFSIHQGSPDGPEISNSLKVSFCLIDWYNMDGTSSTSDRTYWDCERGMQGIQPGWADQYHHELPGQELDITGLEAGSYFLVSEANFNHKYIETNLDDNVAWIQFLLTRDSNGNAKLEEGDHSDCITGVPGNYQDAMCGEIKLNR